jgi:hypothetical protein
MLLCGGIGVARAGARCVHSSVALHRLGPHHGQHDEGGRRSRAELNGVTCDGSPGFMVPASAEYCMRGADDADDEAIFADIVRSLGGDRSGVRKAVATLREIGGGDFAGLDETKTEAAAMTLLRREDW